MPKRLLSVSYDPQLQRSRELILRQAGYDVLSTTSLAEVTAACEHSHFEFALIGHSIPRQQQEKIAAKVREHCDWVVIVGLQLLGTDRLRFADVTVPSHDPAALVEQLRQCGSLAAMTAARELSARRQGRCCRGNLKSHHPRAGFGLGHRELSVDSGVVTRRSRTS